MEALGSGRSGAFPFSRHLRPTTKGVRLRAGRKATEKPSGLRSSLPACLTIKRTAGHRRQHIAHLSRQKERNLLGLEAILFNFLHPSVPLTSSKAHLPSTFCNVDIICDGAYIEITLLSIIIRWEIGSHAWCLHLQPVDRHIGSRANRSDGFKREPIAKIPSSKTPTSPNIFTMTTGSDVGSETQRVQANNLSEASKERPV